jgi:hypothetical protein
MPSPDVQMGVSNRGKVSPKDGKGKAANNSDAGKRGSMKGSPASNPLSSDNDEGANRLMPNDTP